MRLTFPILLFAFLGQSVLQCPSHAQESQTSTVNRQPESVPLSQDDLRDITAQVMATQPILSSSPGIKLADAILIDEEDIALVIYYPHSEEAGVKKAFQVECSRVRPSKVWSCDDASIRRYVALDTQDYEVRLTGPIEFGAVMALIEASRRILPLISDDGLAIPDTVRNISSFDDGGASIVWVNSESGSFVQIVGHLPEGGNPTQPGDWVVNKFDLDAAGLE